MQASIPKKVSHETGARRVPSLSLNTGMVNTVPCHETSIYRVSWDAAADAVNAADESNIAVVKMKEIKRFNM
jgi:hypothetical protein